MQRNFIAFIIVSAAILAGWFYLTNPLGKKADDKTIANIEPPKKTEPPTEPPQKEKNKTPEIKKKEIEPPAKDLQDEPERSEELGGDGYYLSVLVTARGAAVRRVLLNQFDRADWRGRPTSDKLDLIQDDPIAPSFRMYHYEKHDAENPVFGLGEKNWKFKDRKTEEDKTQEVRFSTIVPGMDIEIVKTYRLTPKDYHVTMRLDLSRDAKGEKNPLKFRYQLTGAQGLPIEGEWYATTFRNALVAMVDNNDRAYRDIEESMRISPRQGGDTTPRNKFDRGTVRLQYAITANQYFGAGVVVDDKQPKEDGATTPDKILAWARPTLETREMQGSLVDFDDEHLSLRNADGEVIKFKLLPRTRRHLKDLGFEEKKQDLELALDEKKKELERNGIKKDLKLDLNAKIVVSHYTSPRAERVAAWFRLGVALRPQFDDITVRVNSEAVELLPGDKAVHQFLLYHGPVKAALLGQFTGDKFVSEELVTRYTHTLHLRTLTDYPSDNWFSREIFARIMLTDVIIMVTRFMHWLLNFLQPVVGYGLSIVVLTVMVRGAMFPISRKQAIFSIKMQELAPELKKVQDKYADDPQAKMQATQEFYKKHGINPLGSCWPVFLQMPIFLGLYFAFQESIHFRGADFLWIKSLSAPDMLFEWGELIPYLSTPDHLGSMFYLGPFLNVLPICAVVLMMVQQIQTMPPPTDEQTAMQQKMLKFMSIFFGLMFYKVAAGLCIYFVASSSWGMAERMLLPKKKKTDVAPATNAAMTTTSANGKGPTPPKGKWAKAPKKEKEDETTALGRIKAWWQDVLKQAEKK